MTDDVKPATDEEVALIQWRIENMRYTVPAVEAALVARIRADADRIKALEAEVSWHRPFATTPEYDAIFRAEMKTHD